MSGITTHVLDTARGGPAAGVAVSLAARAGGGWTEIGRATTDADGRVANLLPGKAATTGGGGDGTYRLRFEVGAYFAAQGTKTFYPYVEVVFTLQDERHHHVPLLISPFGYSTYRGG